MVSAITGGIGLASGLVGMIGGLRGAKAASSSGGGSGMAQLMYMLSGQEQQTAAREEAAQYSKQASLAYEQSLIDANQQERQFRSFKEEQALRFASSGGSGGSQLAVLEETEQLGQQEVNATKRRGREVSGLLEMQGLQMLRQGSAAAFSGFAQGLNSRYEGEQRAKQLKTQATQSGLAGLAAGVQGLGTLGNSSTAQRAGRGFLDWFRSQPSNPSLSGLPLPGSQ